MALPQNTKSNEKQTARPSPAETQSATGMIISRLNDLNTRMRLGEERINQNKERLRVFDDQVLGLKKEMSKEIENINSDISDLRKSIKNIEDTIHHIIKELELTAKKQDINVIEKYVDMMDPTRYITKEELKVLMKK
ncbi:MAG: hypothetical protein JW791_00900 [Nanoarchaeota archaeon]|nr:hypothetical protein [Nanoarchaeota archaeon]